MKPDPVTDSTPLGESPDTHEERTTMQTVTVYGASDDLIEVDGDLSEEFSAYDEEDGRLLAFGDGTLLRIVYDKDGIWRITRLVAGSATFEKHEGSVEEDANDMVKLVGDLRWCVCAPADAKVLAK